MKEFDPLQFEIRKCRDELNEYHQLLNSRVELDEREHILPFFRERRHLSAFLASYVPNLSRFDRIAYEFDIFGDFTADLAIGDTRNKTYCLVEFEEGHPDSIFTKKPGKVTPEWSKRFDHGYGQVIDWFWKLEDVQRTDDFENRFGANSVNYHGLLVIGRTAEMSLRERKRLKWRLDRTVVNSKFILCVTYDDLYEHLNDRLRTYELLRHTED